MRVPAWYVVYETVVSCYTAYYVHSKRGIANPCQSMRCLWAICNLGSDALLPNAEPSTWAYRIGCELELCHVRLYSVVISISDWRSSDRIIRRRQFHQWSAIDNSLNQFRNTPSVSKSIRPVTWRPPGSVTYTTTVYCLSRIINVEACEILYDIWHMTNKHPSTRPTAHIITACTGQLTASRSVHDLL